MGARGAIGRVNHVVVDQRGAVDQFDDRPQPHSAIAS